MKKRKGACETPNNNSSRTNIKNFTNVNNNKHKTPEKAKQHDTITNVHLKSRVEPYKYVSGCRKPIAIQIDTGLYKRFKPLAKRVYGSVCRAVELYMVACIETVEKGNVHFSNSVKPIVIEKMVIERNIRSRRRLEYLSDDPEDLACHYCRSLAVGNFRYLKTGQVYPLCSFHAKALLDSKGWEVVKDE